MLEANRDLARFVDQELRSFKVLSAVRIYKGALVGLDRVSGLIRPIEQGDLFMGIAYEECDNSSGSAGARSCRLYTQGDFEVSVSGAVATDIGRPLFALDDSTVALAGDERASIAGRCIDVPAGGTAIMRIEPVWMPQVQHSITSMLGSSTSATSDIPVMITQRTTIITSVEVYFDTPPDAGVFDLGWAASEPDEIVDGFDLSSVIGGLVTLVPLAEATVPIASRIWARVGQATSVAGVNGMCTLRYFELS